MDSHLREVREFAVERRFRQTVLRNAVAQHAAGFRLRVEERRLDPFEPQIIGGRESRRTGADNRDFLPGQFRELLHVFVIVQIRRETLEVVDRDRFAVDIAPALLFAEPRADTADRHRQRNPLLDDLETLEKFALAPGADVLLNARMGRARHRARGFAVAGVLGEQQRERGPAHIENFRRGGVDLLSLRRFRRAARQETAGFLVAHHADEAARGLGNTRFAAEPRDPDPVGFGDIHDGLAGFRRDSPAVQDKFNAHCMEPFLTR